MGLLEPALPAEVEIELHTSQEVHHKVELGFRLEGPAEGHDEVVVNLRQDLLLLQGVGHHVGLDQGILGHYL